MQTHLMLRMKQFHIHKYVHVASAKCLYSALCELAHIPVVPVVIIPTTTSTSLTPRPSASTETTSGEQNVMRMQSNSMYTYVDKLSLHFIHHHTIVKLIVKVSHCKYTLYGLLHTVASPCPQLMVTVTVLSVILSLMLTLSLSTCAVSAVVHAVMYKRLQRCRAELRGGELCSTPQLSLSLL